MSKKISSIIAITAMLSLSLNNLSFIPTVNAASLRTTYKIYGDLNGDNKIDIYDVISMRKEVVKGTYNKTLDFNCDNSIDSADLTILNDYVLGKNAFFDAYLNDDADADDICDMFEIAIFETDPDSKDSDGDTLSDFEEIVYTDTSPTNKFSRGLSITDADDDPDEDGLTNKEEISANEIDFPHFIATLSGQYTSKENRLFIDEDLSGWLGDLQSLIYDLKKETYGTNKDLKEAALNLIAKDNTRFDSTDMFSDIDAKNISCMYNTRGFLSHALEEYYLNSSLKYSSKRFNLFIENSGGINAIKKKAQKYTSQSINPSHQFLTNNADAVTQNFNLFDIYFSNYIIDEHGNKIYTLNLPNIVSKEESEALVYAFTTYIQNGKEKEDER